VNDIFEVTAKYGLPYFQNFIGSQYKRVKDENGNVMRIPNNDAYKPGAVRSMCCRLQLDLRELMKR
jgi:ribonucleoside-triphosphate reductase